VLTTCPGLHSIAERPGFELATYCSQVLRPNHSATEPNRVRHYALIAVVCPSVCLVPDPKSRTEGHSKVKIGRKEADDMGDS